MNGLLLAAIVAAVVLAMFAVWRLQSNPYDAVDEWHEQMRALGDAASSDSRGPPRGVSNEHAHLEGARRALRRVLPRLPRRRGVSPFVH